MAKYSNTVEYNIKTNLDASGIAKLNTQLRQVEAELQRLQGRGVLSDSQVKKDLANINQIKTALASAFNPNLGMLDTKKFMAGLTAGGKTLQTYANTFNSLGTKGAQAFSTWYGQLGKIDTGMRQISKTGDKIMNTFGNTVRWGLIASAFSSVMNAAHQSVQYVQDLDKSLTNIMMVSGETRDNMNDFAKTANEIAIRLGGTTTQMTEATKVFVQQGMNLPQSAEMAEYAVHLANISEQDSSTTSDELTAMKNAFGLEIDDMGNAVSKWAAIANNAAVSMEELSVASQKAASVANTVGVDMDQFAGHIAAIEATTREAPENIGNGLKTLYSRIADIKLGDTLEDGVNYGQFSSALKKIGVDVLDVDGKMKDAGIIIEEIMAKWEDLDKTQRNAVATTVAGRFQLARFEALMNSQDIYKKSVDVAKAETGTETYDRMQDTYRESLEGRSKALQAEIERIFLNAFNTDTFYGLVDAATQLAHVFGDLIEAVGGGGQAVLAFGALLTKVMSNNISRGMANFVENRQRDATIKSNVNEARTNAQMQIRGQGISLKDADAMKVVNQTAQGAQFAHLMNQEQLDKFNASLSERTQLLGALKEAEAQEAQALERFGQAFKESGVTEEAAEKGLIAFLELLQEGGAEINATALQTEGLKKALSTLQNAQGQMSGFAEAINQVAIAEQKFGSESVEYDTALQKMMASAGKLAGNLTQLVESETLTANATEKLTGVIKILEQAENGDFESTEKLALAFKQGQLDVNFFSEALSKLLQEGILTQEEFEKLSGDLALLRERFDSASMGAENLNAHMVMQSKMDTIVNAASAVGQLVFAFQSLKNLGSIWNNEDLEFGEKLEETVLNLAMTVPMLLMSLYQLKPVLTAIKASTLATAAAEIAATFATGGLAAGFSALWAAMAPVLAAAAPFIAAAAAIAAVIWGVVQVARLADEHFHRFDTAVEEATQKVTEANEALNQAKGKLEAINSALDSLDDNPFEGLTRGTQEWADALANANNNILETIEKYPQLAQYVIHGKNGELTFDEKGLQEYKAAVQGEVIAAQARTANAKIEENAAKETQSAVNTLRSGDFEKFKDSFSTTESSPDYTYSTLNYDEKGAADKLAEAAQFMAQNAELSDEDLKQALSDAGIAAGDAADELVAARDSLISLGTNLQENTATLQESTQAYAAAMMSNSEAYQNADAAVQSAVDAKVAEMVQNPTEELQSHAIEAFDNDSQMSWDSGAMQEWYANLQGYAEDVAWEAGKGFVNSAGEVIEADTGDMYGKIKEAYINNHIAEEIAANGDAIVQAYQAPFDQIKGMIGEEGASVFAGNGEINGAALSQDLSGIDWSQLKNSDALKAMGFESYEEFVEAFNEAAAQNPIKPELDEQSIKEQIESMSKDTLDSEGFSLDESVDEDQWKDLSEYIADSANEMEGFSEDLMGNAEAAAEVAEEILRYDSALEECQKSMEDWQDMLGSGNAEDEAEAASQLADVYGDLIGLANGFDLSNAFNANPENLELLQRAMEGDIEAYDELAWRAAEDIVMHCNVDDADTMAQINGLMDQAHAIIDSQEFQDIEIGAACDTGGLEETLNGIITASGMTAEQASSLLASMGVDAELIPVENQETETQEYTNLIPQEGAGTTITATLPSGNASDGSFETTESTFTIPGITWTTQTGTAQDVKTAVGTAVKMTAANGKSSGGGVQIKSGTLKKAASGGAKFANASHGGGAKGGGGGGKGGSCFIAGTPISLNGYYKSIETIQIGDIVLSYNEELKQNEYSEVLETMIHLVKEELYTLYIEDETLTTTGIHRFLIDRDGKQEWIPASDLQINDLVLFADYSWHKIIQIDIEIKATRVYNFEVSNNHNYYVGRNQILAHNKGGGGKGNKGKEPKETNRAKSAEVENDIYQKVNATLKKLNDQYSKLDKVTQRIYGPAQRNNINKQLKLIAKENEETKERVDIAKAYLKALQSGKSNPAYGISMKDKPSMKDTGLVDKDKDGVIDNYIQKFEAARQAAQAADKAADDYYTNLGGKIDKKGNVITEAQMTEDQQKEYEKLTKAAEKLWKKAEDINTVQKEYEDTWSQIREDEEKMLEYQQQMEDLMIDLYHTALDAADAIKDIKDSSAELKGLFAGFSSDSPFRALISDAQKFQDIMSATDKEFDDYIDDAVKVLEKELEAVKSQGDKDKIAAYQNSIKWYKDKKAEYDTNDIGKGELGMATLQLEEMSRWMEQVKKGELTGLPADSPYRTNTKQLFEDYEAQYKKVAQLTLEAEERMEKMQKDVLDAYEYAADREQKILDKYDKIQKDLERTADRVTLWQGEDAYKAQIDLLKQQAQVAIENIQAEKKQYDTWVKKRDAAIAKEDAERVERLNQIDAVIRDLETKRAAAKTKAEKLDYEQQIAAQKALYAEQETAYSDATQYLIDHTEEMWEDIKDLQDEAAEAMRDAYLAQIDEINAAMTERLFGDRNLSNLTNDWDWDKEYFTTYKDTVEKTYETEKLRLKYMDLLDEAQGMSLATQRKIKQAMEEQLALLANQATVSKYDVDLANARLEILQKQIALENAQQNKTQMKLRRDTQGNYKYVYAADQGDVRDKESELLDAQFDAYEMSKEANRNAYDSAIGMYNQYVEQRKALAEKYKNDREKLDEELKKLDENYTRAAEANAEDLKNSYDGIVLSVEWMAKSNIENIAAMTDEVLENLKEHNQEALEAIGIPWNDAIGNAIEDFETIKEEAANTTSELLKNVDEFVDFISGDNGIGAATGEQYGQAKEAINSAKDATKDLKEETENLNKALTQELGATSAAEEKIAEYETQLRAAKESTSALASKLSSTEQTLINTQQEKEKYKTKYENAVTEAANEKRMRKGQFERGDEFVLKKGTVVYYGRGGGQSDAKGRKSYTLEKDTKVRVQSTHQPVLDKNGRPTGQISQYHVGFFATDRKQVVPDRDDNPETRENEQWHLDPAGLVSAMKLDTGGYTGDWNNKAEGRLAILHEKELVLNRTDTENILNAVKLVRDAIAQIKAASITDVFKNTSNFSSHGGDTIEQRVEIVAEFPNANSAEEIKRALLGLADSAMQYSYREKSLT